MLTEGGHAELAPRSALEWELLSWIRDRIGCTHVSTERVVSHHAFRIVLTNTYSVLCADLAVLRT
jgi:glucokinase